jgi:hypothetical protein
MTLTQEETTMTPVPSAKEHFFLREGFESFRVDPEHNPELLLGERDRAQRDELLDGIAQDCLMGEGFKAVVYGSYGRGKTHQAKNLIHECGSLRRDLPVKPVYVQCIEFRPKEPFATLFGQMLEALGVKDVNRVAEQYERRVRDGEEKKIDDIVGSDEIARAFDALSKPSEATVRTALRWLGGEKLDRHDRSKIHDSIVSTLAYSRDFAAVIRGLAHMYRQIDGHIIIFFIDEAERLGRISQVDAYLGWQAGLRALTELSEIGIVFFVGGKTRDDVPDMLTWDEVSTRIGNANYRDMIDPGAEARENWVIELFATLVRKGPLPPVIRDMIKDDRDEDAIPEGLRAIVGDDERKLRAYPFTPEALTAFIEETESELANKPREMLKRIQRGAGRALMMNLSVIDVDALEATRGEGY